MYGVINELDYINRSYGWMVTCETQEEAIKDATAKTLKNNAPYLVIELDVMLRLTPEVKVTPV